MSSMDDDIAIKVEHVSKDFRYSAARANTLKSMFTSLLHKGDKPTPKELQHALKDVSFEVKKGEFFGIVGRNGSGKSTLLKILAGIYQPNKGKTQVRGRLVPFIELGVGFNPELTGRENVYLNGALLNFSKQEIDAFYKEVVEFAELEDFMDKKLKNYSSGMQVRLAFSMAIRAKADILLVDEVLAVGDTDFQRKCFEYFRRLKKDKKTVVFVSHDMNAIREYCNKVVLIEKNKVLLKGSANRVADAYTKMFLNDASKDRSERDEERWGDGSMVISEPSLSIDAVKDKDKHVVLDMTVTAKEDIERPIFGFSITAPNGTQVLGTNSQIRRQSIDELKKNEAIHVQWKIPNIFADGAHYINLAAVYANGTKTADWWDEALSFEVFREEKTPYIVSPHIDLDMKVEENAKH